MQTVGTLVDIARALDAAPFRERGELMLAHAISLGVSIQTLYRRLQRDVGWSSGRKTRSDYGQRVISRDEAELIAALKREGSRKNGKRLVSTEQAVMLANHAGSGISVTRGTMDRTLRALGMQADRLNAPIPAVELRSLHPNHVMGVDPSLCVIFYLKGKQYIMEEAEFNRNKLENYAKVKTKVWRYVAADHRSAVYWVRYYQVDGENQRTLFEFLMWVWTKTDGRTAYGVPKILMMDAGSANKARSIAVLCKAMGVELIINRPGNPRAKGFVEKAQDVVERGFESLLRFQPVETVEEMNRRVSQWQELFNANLLTDCDTRLNRDGMAKPMPRIDLWLTIKADELRDNLSRPICDWLMQGHGHERTLDGRRRISYRHPNAAAPTIYDLRDIDGLHTHDKVFVVPLMLSPHCEVLIRTVNYQGIETYHPVLPIADFNAIFGGRESSPIIGQEFKAQPKSDVEYTHEAMDRAAYGIDEDGVIRDKEAIAKAKKARVKPFAHLNDGQGLRPFDAMMDVETRTNLPKRSTPAVVDLPNVSTISSRFEADEKRKAGRMIGTPDAYDAAPEHVYSVIAAAQLMRERLGDEWTAEHFQRLATAYPDGVPETRIDEAYAQIKRAAMFRLVDGGAA